MSRISSAQMKKSEKAAAQRGTRLCAIGTVARVSTVLVASLDGLAAPVVVLVVLFETGAAPANTIAIPGAGTLTAHPLVQSICTLEAAHESAALTSFPSPTPLSVSPPQEMFVVSAMLTAVRYFTVIALLEPDLKDEEGRENETEDADAEVVLS